MFALKVCLLLNYQESRHYSGRDVGEAEAAHEEVGMVRQQLRQAQQAAKTALERLEAESSQRQRAEAKVASSSAPSVILLLHTHGGVQILLVHSSLGSC